MKMTEMNAVNTQSIADYLAQLLKDRKQITAFPNMFMHVERLIDEGNFKIVNNLWCSHSQELLPIADGIQYDIL